MLDASASGLGEGDGPEMDHGHSNAVKRIRLEKMAVHTEMSLVSRGGYATRRAR